MKHHIHPTAGQFVHMPKTGGTWVRRKCLDEKGNADHDRAIDYPGKTWCIVRKPADWYESLYLHCIRANKLIDLKRWGGGSLEFKDVLYGWTHPSRDRVPLFNPAVLWELPRTLDGEPWEYVLGDMEHGFYTWAAEWFFCGEDGDIAVDDVLRFDDLAPSVCAKLGLDIAPERHNGRTEGQSVEWDKDMRAWVKAADGAMWRRALRWSRRS